MASLCVLNLESLIPLRKYLMQQKAKNVKIFLTQDNSLPAQIKVIVAIEHVAFTGRPTNK